MIRQWEDIDQRLLIGMNTSYYLYRFINQFPPTINFELIFGTFVNFSNLPFEWICARQGTVGTLNGIHRNAMVVIPNPAYTDLCQFIAYLQSIFLWNKNFKFYINKVFHDITL